MPTRIYIASGLGFGALTRTTVLARIISKVESMGFEVIDPFRDNNELDCITKRSIDTELQIARNDIEGVRRADAVLCVISSPIPDEGSMIEVGYAMALGKSVFYLNDDFRYSPDMSLNALPMNLMLFAEMDSKTWQTIYYTCIEQLDRENMGLRMLLSRNTLKVAPE